MINKNKIEGDYLRKPTESFKERYANMADEDGYVRVVAFAITELRRQVKSVAALLDGDEGQNPEYDLGKGLKYKGASGNYGDMMIHIDDLDKFIARVKAYFKE